MWIAFDPPFWWKLRMNAITADQCQSFQSAPQPARQLQQINGSPPSSSVTHLLFGGVWWVSEVNEVTMEPFTSVCFQILDVDTESCISSWDCSWFTNMEHFQRFPRGSSSHNGSYSTCQGSKYIYPKYTHILGDWGKSPKVGPTVRQTGQNSITWFQQTLSTQRVVMVFRVPWNPFQFRAFIQQSLKILGMYIAYTCGSRAFPQKDPASPSRCTRFV